jgi:hypothetical protein
MLEDDAVNVSGVLDTNTDQMSRGNILQQYSSPTRQLLYTINGVNSDAFRFPGVDNEQPDWLLPSSCYKTDRIANVFAPIP